MLPGFNCKLRSYARGLIYNTLCGPGDTQTITGEFDFKPGGKLVGSGFIRGIKYCGQGLTLVSLSAQLEHPRVHMRAELSGYGYTTARVELRKWTSVRP